MKKIFIRGVDDLMNAIIGETSNKRSKSEYLNFVFFVLIALISITLFVVSQS